MLRDPQTPEWSAQLTPTDSPAFDLSPVDLSASLDDAHNRPELKRLNLQKEITGLDIQYFKNQTKPQADLTGTIATTGLAGTACSTVTNPLCIAPPTNLVGGYGKDLANLAGLEHEQHYRRGRDFSADSQHDGQGKSRRRANHEGATRRFLPSQDQAIEMDVRNAAQSVDTAQKRVVASRAARESAEQQLAGEQKLYDVGRSTTFLLLQRQQELTAARTNELQAQTDYNKALADLQRATGSTLRVNNVVVNPNP